MRLLISLALLVLLTACGSDETIHKIAGNKDAAQAMHLARQNGCTNCHGLANSIVGPAWELVSERYQNVQGAREFLIEKVKKGGNGSWNDITGGAKMPAHENRVKPEHIEQLVDFILSLKNEKK